jgi:nucleoside-diphosphate-sugar epimerase
VHGDGMSLWTLTRCVDFAVPFVKLLDNPAALNDDFQITNDRAFTWNEITRAIATGLGVEAKIVNVPSDTLVRYYPAWEGPLWGDKSWPALFDNSKVKRVAGNFTCAQDLATIVEDSVANFRRRNARESQAPHELDPLMDRICAEQAGLGA